MTIVDNKKMFLTYCLNLHRGETMDEVEHALFVTAPSILKRIIQSGAPSAVGPWFNSHIAQQILETGNLEKLKQKFEDAGLLAITLNGFPYSTFHDERVKERVYLPDWSSPQRLEYTLNLLEILSLLLPKGVNGSISTLPVGYAALSSNEIIKRSVENMAECALHFHACAQERETEIILSIEPEPDCVVGDMDEFVKFYNNRLLRSGVQHLGSRYGISAPRAEIIIRKHIGICMDTVHAAVSNENLEEWLERLEKEGIKIGKIQLGAALRADGPDFFELKSFDDPVYLHQTRFIHGTNTEKYPDLPDFLSNTANLSSEGHAVVHYHMPFTWRGKGALTSCHRITSKFLEKALSLGVSCFELEIYTLSVFPEFRNAEEFKRERLISDILTAELRWLMEKFDAVTQLQEA